MLDIMLEVIFKAFGLTMVTLSVIAVFQLPFDVGKERKVLTVTDVVRSQVSAVLFVIWAVYALYRLW